MNASPEGLVESDFDSCFVGEPVSPPVADDLARGRGRRRRRWGAAGAVGGTALLVAATFAVLPGADQLDAAPAQTVAPVTPSAASPSSTPRGVKVAPPVPKDTAPPLTYSKAKGYRDQDGRTLASARGTPFSRTTKHTYDLVRSHLDPRQRHLDPYEATSFSGGGGDDSIEIGQKLGWSIAGQPGQGMLLVSVTRKAPGAEPKTKGTERDGLCGGGFVDVTCRADTIDGRQVFLGRLADGGYVVDYVQPDGEIAGAWVTPVFGNNTSIALKKMNVPAADVVALLADPQLDVVG